MVLAGGEGKRLAPLTNDRAKPAVPFGGLVPADRLRAVEFRQRRLPADRRPHAVQEPLARPAHQPDAGGFSTMLANYVTPVPAQMRRGPYWFTGLGRRDLPEPEPDLATSGPTSSACSAPTTSTGWIRARWSTHHLDERGRRDGGGDPGPDRGRPGARRDRERRRRSDRRTSTRSRPTPPAMPGDPTPLPGVDGQLRLRHADPDRRGDTARRRDTVRRRRRRDPGARRRPASRTSTTSRRTRSPARKRASAGYWRDVGTLDAYYDTNMDLVAHAPGLRPLQRPLAGLHPPASAPTGEDLGGDRRAGRTSGRACSARARSSRGRVSSSRSSGPGVRIREAAHVSESILLPDVTRRRPRAPAPVHRRQERRRTARHGDRCRRRRRPRALHHLRQRDRGDREGLRPERRTRDRPRAAAHRPRPAPVRRRQPLRPPPQARCTPPHARRGGRRRVLGVGAERDAVFASRRLGGVGRRGSSSGRSGGSGVWEGFARDAAVGASLQAPARERAAGSSRRPILLRGRRSCRPGTRRSLTVGGARVGGRGVDRRAGGAACSPAAPISIYEVHLGSWRPGLGYREVAPLLADHCERLGFTHVQLLPVMEHPFTGSWGYQVTGFFSPTARFGSPDDLRVLRRSPPPARDRRDPRLGAGPLPRRPARARPLRRDGALRARGPAAGAASGLGEPDLQLRAQRGRSRS